MPASRPTIRSVVVSYALIRVICDPMWQCSPTRRSAGCASTRGDRVGRGAVVEIEPELLVRHAGGYRLVHVGVHPVGHPDPDVLPVTHLGGELRDLVSRVENDPTHTRAERGLQVLGSLHIAVQHDPLGREPSGPGHRQLAGRAHIK
jgi:hypothetical protein